MNPPERLDPQLLEMLSAYLDGRLEDAEKAALEARLNKEGSLRRQLAELRLVRESLRTLPLLKPPRSLALTPAMAGKPAQKPAGFSPRALALGSALASLAFVCVLSVNLFSRGIFLPGASAPRVQSENESFAGPPQSETGTGAGKAAAIVATAGLASTQPPPPNATAQVGTGSDNSVPTETAEAPTSLPVLGGGCADCAPSEERALTPPQLMSVHAPATPQPRALPDFQTVTLYLEVFLALAAAILAAAAALTAIFFRRRR